MLTSDGDRLTVCAGVNTLTYARYDPSVTSQPILRVMLLVHPSHQVADALNLLKIDENVHFNCNKAVDEIG